LLGTSGCSWLLPRRRLPLPVPLPNSSCVTRLCDSLVRDGMSSLASRSVALSLVYMILSPVGTVLMTLASNHLFWNLQKNNWSLASKS
jgi:hypothetical protein